MLTSSPYLIAMAKTGNPTEKKKFQPILEKDDEELELEKIVFGDAEGFEAGLKNLDLEHYGESDLEEQGSLANDGQTSSIGSLDPTQMQDSNLFFVDEGEAQDFSGSEEGSASSNTSDSEDSDQISDEEPDAWFDSDDEKLQVSLVSSAKLRKLRDSMSEEMVQGKDYSKRLRSRFQKLYPVPDWAKQQEDDDSRTDSENEDMNDADDDGDEVSVISAKNALGDMLKQKSTFITASGSKLLPSGVVDIARLKDASISVKSQSAVQNLQFHPTHHLLLSGGYDRTMRLYHIDGKKNPLATSLHIRQSPFQTTQFHPDGQRVFGAGRRKYLYIWNIQTGLAEKITRMYGHEDTQRSMENFRISPCGRYIGMVGSGGWLNVLLASTGQWITGAKIEGDIADIAWTHDGEKALIVNTAGDVWEWSSSTRKFENRWKDESGVGVTRIALSGPANGDRYVAIGSKSGIVNVYDRNHITVGMKLSDAEAPTYKPIAVLDQLVTSISSLVFSPDSQMLAIASRAKRDAFRLVHVPTFTVFKNWPTSSTPLGRVTAVAFSPGCEMLAIGNLAGNARLWNFNHYTG